MQIIEIIKDLENSVIQVWDKESIIVFLKTYLTNEALDTLGSKQ